MDHSPTRPRTPANRFGVDYSAEAARLGPPVVPIIDAHMHVAGKQAPMVFDRVRRLFGVERVHTMTQLAQVEPVREALGDAVQFIAFPSFSEPDRAHAFRGGYLDVIRTFRERYDARILKLWASPRLRDLIPEIADQPYGTTDLAEVDAPWRVRACEVGADLGMMFMIHIADPDTWYASRYTRAEKYGPKRAEYERFERMLDRFPGPWIAAHMGGWPEDLPFLDGLLSRHPNLHLDTSATKWVVRALGRQPREATRAWFEKWASAGRVLFGSDIVVTDDHMTPKKAVAHPMGDLADSPEAAFDLYCSRYWALRTMFESTYEGESNIADPDLAMVEPEKHGPMSAPTLRGIGLPARTLAALYRGGVERLLGANSSQT